MLQFGRGTTRLNITYPISYKKYGYPTMAISEGADWWNCHEIWDISGVGFKATSRSAQNGNETTGLWVYWFSIGF